MSTIESQLKSVNDGGTILFDTDHTEEVKLEGRRVVTFDLGGHVWTAPDGKTPLTVDGAQVIIRNGTIRSKGNACIRAGVKGTSRESLITLDPDLKLVSEDHACVFITKGASVDTSADMTSNGIIACIQGNGTKDHWGNSCTIRGGIISAPNSTAIYWPQVGDLIIRGGEISGLTGVEVRAGSLLVTGGRISTTAGSSEFQANSNGSVSNGVPVTICQYDPSQPITVRITGGTFVGGTFNGACSFVETDIQYPGGTRGLILSIEGGTFTRPVEVASMRTPFISGGTFPADQNSASYFVSGAQYTYDEGAGTITWYMPSKTDTPWHMSDLRVDGVVSSTGQGMLLGSGDGEPADPVEGAVYYNTHEHKWFVFKDGGWASEDFDITESGIVEGSTKPVSSDAVFDMKGDIDAELGERYTKTEVDDKLSGKQNVIPSTSAISNFLGGTALPKDYILRSDADGRIVTSGLTEKDITDTSSGLTTANNNISDLQNRVNALETKTPDRQDTVVSLGSLFTVSKEADTGGPTGYPVIWKVASASISEKDFAHVEFGEGTMFRMSNRCDTYEGYLRLYSKTADAPVISDIILVKG